MKAANKWTMATVSGLVLILGASSSWAVLYTFGSNNDGLAGFTQSSVDAAQESWSTQADSVRYINDDPDGIVDSGTDGGTRNGSLLRSIPLNRSIGSTYTMEGVVQLSNGYADDNNRIGIYLFGDVNDLGDGTVGQNETGALYLRFNTDKGTVDIYEGLDLNTALATQPKAGGYLAEDDSMYAGSMLTLKAALDFVDAGGTTNIDVAFTLTDGLGDVTTVNTSVPAADYTGNYFGFASRARNRGVISSDRNAPFTMDYKTFEVSGTAIPEPGTFAMFAMMGALLFIRHRARSM